MADRSTLFSMHTACRCFISGAFHHMEQYPQILRNYWNVSVSMLELFTYWFVAPVLVPFSQFDKICMLAVLLQTCCLSRFASSALVALFSLLTSASAWDVSRGLGWFSGSRAHLYGTSWFWFGYLSCPYITDRIPRLHRAIRGPTGKYFAWLLARALACWLTVSSSPTVFLHASWIPDIYCHTACPCPETLYPVNLSPHFCQFLLARSLFPRLEFIDQLVWYKSRLHTEVWHTPFW